MTWGDILIMTEPTVTARPALTREARKAETRRALIHAAAELFAEQGMERTSLDEIAARVGLTKGAIYANFRNREELIDAVSREYSQVTGADILFDSELSLAERLAILGREVAEFMPHMRPLNMMLHLEFELYVQRHPERAIQERRENQAWLAEEGRKLEAAARQRGEQLPLSGAELNALWLGMARGIAFEWLRDPDSITPEGVAQFFALVGRGIQDWTEEAATREAGETLGE
jgi:AcrR family transcriptional regulator